MTADAGYTEEETLEFVAQLKEIGLVNFLRQYLEPLDDGSRRSLRKLMLAIGAVPVSPHQHAYASRLGVLSVIAVSG